MDVYRGVAKAGRRSGGAPPVDPLSGPPQPVAARPKSPQQQQPSHQDPDAAAELVTEQQRRVVDLPPTEQAKQQPTSKAAASSSVASPSSADAAPSVDELESQLRSVSAELAHCEAAIQDLTRERKVLEDPQQQHETNERAKKIDREIQHAIQSKQDAKDKLTVAMKGIADTGARKLKELHEEFAKQRKAEFADARDALQAELAKENAEVEALRQTHDAIVATMTNQGERRDVAVLQQKLAAFYTDMREKHQQQLRAAVQDEGKIALVGLAESRRRDAQNNRLVQQRHLASYRENRAKKFSEFRQSRREERLVAAEKQRNSFAARREKSLEQLSSNTAAKMSEREELFDAAARRTHVEAQQSLERTLENQRFALQQDEKIWSSREFDAAKRCELELQSFERMHATEKQALLTRLGRDLGTEMKAATEVGIQNTFGDVSSSLSVLSSRVKELQSDVSRVTASLSVEKRFGASSSVEAQRAKEVQEQAISQCRREIDDLKNQVDVKWGQLANLLEDFESLAESCSQQISTGRSAVDSLQNRIDATRGAWEKEHREQLGAVGPLNSSGHELGLFLELSWKLRQLVEKSKKLSHCREQHDRNFDTADQDLQNRHSTLSMLNLKVLEKYDEIAKSVALCDLKRREFEREEADLRAAQGAMREDQAEFQQAAAALQIVSDRLKEEASFVAQQHKDSAKMLLLTRRAPPMHAVQQQPSRRTRDPNQSSSSAAMLVGEFTNLFRAASAASSADDNNREQQNKMAHRGASSGGGSTATGSRSLTTPTPDSPPTPVQQAAAADQHLLLHGAAAAK